MTVPTPVRLPRDGRTAVRTDVYCGCYLTSLRREPSYRLITFSKQLVTEVCPRCGEGRNWLRADFLKYSPALRFVYRRLPFSGSLARKAVA